MISGHGAINGGESTFSLPVEDLDQIQHWEYWLQLSLGTSNMHISRAWNLSTTDRLSQFRRFSKILDGPLVYSWLQVSQLPPGNSVDSLLAGDVNINWTEVGMPTGLLPYDRASNQGQDKFFMLCLVAPGRSFARSMQQLPPFFPGQIPDAYSSTCYFQTDGSGVRFRQVYNVRRSEQVLPVCLAQIQFVRLGISVKAPVCDLCEAPAVFYCSQDEAHFCAKCDTEQHVGLQQSHKRVRVSESPFQFGNCAWHPNENVSCVCITCWQPLCELCMRIGRHSGATFSKHQILSTTDAFSLAMRSAAPSSLRANERRKNLMVILKEKQKKVVALNSNFEQLSNRLEEICKSTVLYLRGVYNKKLQYLHASRREILGYALAVEWAMAFFKHAKNTLPAEMFLRASRAHAAFVAFGLNPAIAPLNPEQLSSQIDPYIFRNAAMIKAAESDNNNNATNSGTDQLSLMQLKEEREKILQLQLWLKSGDPTLLRTALSFGLEGSEQDVRRRLPRWISQRLVVDGNIRVITVDPNERIRSSLNMTNSTSRKSIYGDTGANGNTSSSALISSFHSDQITANADEQFAIPFAQKMPVRHVLDAYVERAQVEYERAAENLPSPRLGRTQASLSGQFLGKNSNNMVDGITASPPTFGALPMKKSVASPLSGTSTSMAAQATSLLATNVVKQLVKQPPPAQSFPLPVPQQMKKTTTFDTHQKGVTSTINTVVTAPTVQSNNVVTNNSVKQPPPPPMSKGAQSLSNGAQPRPSQQSASPPPPPVKMMKASTGSSSIPLPPPRPSQNSPPPPPPSTNANAKQPPSVSIANSNSTGNLHKASPPPPPRPSANMINNTNSNNTTLNQSNMNPNQPPLQMARSSIINTASAGSTAFKKGPPPPPPPPSLQQGGLRASTSQPVNTSNNVSSTTTVPMQPRISLPPPPPVTLQKASASSVYPPPTLTNNAASMSPPAVLKQSTTQLNAHPASMAASSSAKAPSMMASSAGSRLPPPPPPTKKMM